MPRPKVHKLASDKLRGTYLDNRVNDSGVSQAEKGVIGAIFKCKDNSEMIARLGCLMLDNGCLDEAEDMDLWIAFGLAVMLELGNRGLSSHGQ